MALQETGVKAEIKDLDGFMAGLKMMNAGIAEMGKTIAASAKQSKSAQAPMGGLGDMVKNMVGTLTSAAGGVGTLVTAIGGPVGLVVAIGAAAMAVMTAITSLKKFGEAVMQTVQRVVQGLFQMGQEGLMLAGRFNEMEFAALAVGRAMGQTDEEIKGAIDEISEAGIRYDVAAQSATRLMRNQIDLANSSELVAIAQATGIMVGRDSSETFNSLIHAITTGNTAMLGYMNITVTQNDIDREALELYGRKGKALAQQEKMQARVNAIIKQSANVMGVYDAAMESPTKALRSLTGRVLPSLKAELMKGFLPAFKSGVTGISNFAKGIIAAAQEGGALYPILVKLGAVASIIGDGFEWLSLQVKDNMDGIVGAIEWAVRVVDRLLGLLFAPANWIRQVLSVLTGVETEFQTHFSGLVEETFRWGAEIVASFAEGMVTAAHQAMKTVATAINNLMTFWFMPGSPPRAVPDLDKWASETMVGYLEAFTDADYSILGTVQNAMKSYLDPAAMGALSKDLIGMLAGGEDPGETFFARIARGTGIYGREVAELARLQNKLAQATERLNAADERLLNSQMEVTGLTKEYNDLLKQGASQQALSAKLAEIQAAEQERTAAVQERQAIATNIPQLQKEFNLQKQLIDQLNSLANMARSNIAATKDKAKGAMKDLAEIAAAGGEAVGGGFSTAMGEAIERMKETIKQKFADIFQPLVDAWKNIQELIFGTEITEYKGSVLETRYVGGMVQMFDQMKNDIKLIVDDLILKWEQFRAKIFLVFTGIETTISMWKAKLQTWFTVTVPGYIDIVKDKLMKEFIPEWEKLRDVIGGDDSSVLSVLQKLGDKFIDWFMPDIMEPFLEFLKGKKGLHWALEEVVSIFWRPHGLIEGITTVARVIIEAAEAWQDMIEVFDKATAAALGTPYVGQSPSPLERGFVGATRAMRQMIPALDHTTAAFSKAGTRALMAGSVPVSPTMIGGGGGTTNNSRVASINIGTVNINSGMSWAQFKGQVEKAIVSAA